MTTGLRQTIEAELDRLKANADATTEHFMHGGEGLDWPAMPAVLREYTSDWLPARTLPLIAAARRILALHRMGAIGVCIGCGWSPDGALPDDGGAACPDLVILADGLGLSADHTTSEEQHHG